MPNKCLEWLLRKDKQFVAAGDKNLMLFQLKPRVEKWRREAGEEGAKGLCLVLLMCGCVFTCIAHMCSMQECAPTPSPYKYLWRAEVKPWASSSITLSVLRQSYLWTWNLPIRTLAGQRAPESLLSPPSQHSLYKDIPHVWVCVCAKQKDYKLKINQSGQHSRTFLSQNKSWYSFLILFFFI